MRRVLPFLFLLLMFSSCVTMFNRKTTHFYVRTNERDAVLICHKEYVGIKTRKGIVHPAEGTAVPIRKKGVCVLVRRSQTQVLPVTVRKGSVERTINVKPRHSPAYYANFAHIYPFLAAGFLVDRHNPNRFGYPRRVYVDLYDSTRLPYALFGAPEFVAHPQKAPYFDIDISPPFGNFTVYGLDKMQPGVCALSLSAGINYHYAQCKYVSLEGGVARQILFGERFPVDSSQVAKYGLPLNETSNGWYATARDNYALGRIDLGYGLSFGKNYADKRYTTLKQTDSVVYHNSSYSLGLSFCATYRIKRFLSVYVAYQPLLVPFNRSVPFGSEYLISFGMKFRAGLMRKK